MLAAVVGLAVAALAASVAIGTGDGAPAASHAASTAAAIASRHVRPQAKEVPSARSAGRHARLLERHL
jgi:hypothetical protein